MKPRFNSLSTIQCLGAPQDGAASSVGAKGFIAPALSTNSTAPKFTDSFRRLNAIRSRNSRAHDSRRYANGGCAGRHVIQDDGIGSDLSVISDHDSTEKLSTGTYIDMPT